MQQLAGYLARAMNERSPQRVRVGAPHEIDVPPGATELLVERPDGTRTGFKGDALSAGEVTLKETELPGIYRVLVRTNEDLEAPPGYAFVVQTDPQESDTTRIDPAELSAFLGIEAENGGGEGALSLPTAAAAGGGHPLWSALLVLAVLAFSTEGWLLYR